MHPCRLALLTLLGISTSIASSQVVYKLATFNTGLTSSNLVKNYQKRKEALLKELPSSTADVICLQEIWLERDIEAMLSATQSAFPHFNKLVTSPKEGSSVPCTSASAFNSVSACSLANCSDAISEGIGAFTACTALHCTPLIEALSQVCLNCIMSTPVDDPLNCRRPQRTSYQSTHGLLLLSKHPMLNKRNGNYTQELQNENENPSRGYLAADISGIGTVVCTHLENYEPAYYAGPKRYTGAKNEQEVSIIRLLQGFPSDSSALPTFLLGTFNHGPRVNNTLAPLYPDHYQRILDAGYASPAVSLLSECSFCDSNVLARDFDLLPSIRTKYNSSANGTLIDHIYVPEALSKNVTSVEREYVANVTGADYPLSYHYGVTVALLLDVDMTTPATQKATPTFAPSSEPGSSSAAIAYTSSSLAVLTGLASLAVYLALHEK